MDRNVGSRNRPNESVGTRAVIRLLLFREGLSAPIGSAAPIRSVGPAVVGVVVGVVIGVPIIGVGVRIVVRVHVRVVV
jgi:hypothetical protein